MIDSSAMSATVVAGTSLLGTGVALLRTRSRLSGLLMLLAAATLAASALARHLGEEPTATLLLAGALLLPGAMAVLAFPRASAVHPVDFTAWVVVAGTGVVGTATALRPELAAAFMTISPIALVAHCWLVLETGEEADRQAMLWWVSAVLITGTLAGLVGLQLGRDGALLATALVSLAPPAMAVGVRRPDVGDARSVTVAAVVLVVAALTYLSVYFAAVAALGLVGWDGEGVGVYAFLAVLLAAGFGPLRTVLRGLIDELLFGERRDPLDAATEVAGRVGDDPVLALRAIREALLLPYASLRADGVELATSGTLSTEPRRIPLGFGEESVGEMVVGLPPGSVRLSPGDEQVLRLVAPLLAQTIRARALAAQVAESRQAAISSIEEERRRLRRDLHDGLGPTLSGIAHTAEAARNTIGSDPASADALLGRLRGFAADAVGEVRRLVYDMRPPALDELGLEGALRQQFDVMATPAGRPMVVLLEAADLPPLPAAVEVAAYRIATEAVANAARHSGTDRADVRIGCRGACLVVTIRDPGAGSAAWVPGVGLSSMRERAAEVGGSVTWSSGERGSLVQAELPGEGPAPGGPGSR
ncbi:sensor histidine kinase [Nocardioides sp.]|uniref:sensor histidine kinase n=1 Tax=Nocardioides sp. TaxID=35761 RepID=UPI003528EFE2